MQHGTKFMKNGIHYSFLCFYVLVLVLLVTNIIACTQDKANGKELIAAVKKAYSYTETHYNFKVLKITKTDPEDRTIIDRERYSHIGWVSITYIDSCVDADKLVPPSI